MVERIRKLLEARQLSPTQFADIIGVARPIISHVLSGRNKPSLDVVQRILGAMPELSMAWLLNGTGPMLVADTSAGNSAAPATATQTQVTADKQDVSELTSFSQPTPARPVARPKATFPTKPPASSLIPNRFTQPNRYPEAAKPITSPVAASNVPLVEVPIAPRPASSPAEVVTDELSDNSLAAAMNPKKAIKRIVVFYRDGSFADYQPEE